MSSSINSAAPIRKCIDTAKKEIKPGDLIQISRDDWINHWAVYVGDGKVVHLGAAGSGAGKGVVVKEKLEDVVKKDKWRVNNPLDNDYTPRPALVIVEKACKLVDTELQYDLKNYNCENFATEMRYGKPGNRQVKNVTPEAPVAGTTVMEKVLSWFFASSNSASSISKYFDTEKKEIQPGDRIEIFRDGYQHWAVYVGEGDVVHLVTHESGAGTGKVVKEKLQDIVNKDFHRINNVLDDEYTPRSAKYIVEKAVKMVDKKKKYSVMHFNCEHVATHLRYGKAVCQQVTNKAAKTAGVGAVALGVGLAVPGPVGVVVGLGGALAVGLGLGVVTAEKVIAVPLEEQAAAKMEK